MSKTRSTVKQTEGMDLVLPVDLKNRLRERAQQDRRSMTKTIQVALERFLSQPLDSRQEQNRKHVGVVNSFDDISERKRAARKTSLLAAIVECSDDAIVSKNLDGIITSWNRGAEQLFGYTAEEAIGQNIKLIIPRDRLAEEVTILNRLRRGERLDHFETVHVHKDSTMLNVSLTISPVRDAAGRVIGASTIARDIRERKQTRKGPQGKRTLGASA